jgi:O-acetylhomoserine/O-acetylserine sulfhydrylase-like pyridoxal-dependent enzyme
MREDTHDRRPDLRLRHAPDPRGRAPRSGHRRAQTPIYQTTAYVFRDAEHAAALFNLQEVGFIYSRLTNPTIAVLQERIATLEGGVGAVCCSSGHAAQIMALFPLMGPGKNIVVSTRLYGGTVTQFSQTIRRFGWSAKFVDFDDLDAVEGRDRRGHARRVLRIHRQSRRLHHRHPRASPPWPTRRACR